MTHHLDPFLTVIDRALAARDRTLTLLLGPRCGYGCGERVYAKDRSGHEYYEHAGEEQT